MADTPHTNGDMSPAHKNGGLSPSRVSGLTSTAMVQLLADQGVPANEVVVTCAECHGTGDTARWSVTVLRGRDRAIHSFSSELVDVVLTKGPNEEWYSEVGRLLEGVGMAFPA